MRNMLIAVAAMFAASLAFAQVPTDQLQNAQRKAGAAFNDLQKAEFESKQAEKEYRDAEENHKSVQKQADLQKAQADAARKKLEAAKAREAGLRKTYDAAVEDVDKLAPPRKK